MIKKIIPFMGLLMSLALLGSTAMANDENNGNGMVASPLSGAALNRAFESRLSSVNSDIKSKGYYDSVSVSGPACEKALSALQAEYENTALILTNYVCEPDSEGKPQIMQRPW